MTRIIALEGIDGTGKGTQAERLAAKLREAGRRVETLSFPDYASYFGDYVGRYLTGRDGVRADTVDGKSMALWFALDRWEAFRGRDLSQVDVLIINRYVLSNAVYQSIRERDLGEPDLLDFVLTTEFDHFCIPRPDRTLLLDVAPTDAAENVGKKGFREYVGDGRDIYEALPSLQTRARAKYLEYAARIPGVTVIPCMEGTRLKSIEAIGALIDAALADLL